jgi:hypothetical protein
LQKQPFVFFIQRCLEIDMENSKRNTFIQPMVWSAVLIVAVASLALTYRHWQPAANRFLMFIQNQQPDDGHDHPDEPGVMNQLPDTLMLSPEARKNIGLVTQRVKPADFEKFVSVPAMVVERPGRSQIEITAPMTGVVSHVFPLERALIDPGTLLFKLRLTHEDVVSAQAEFLNNLQLADVISKELQRLQAIGEGVLPGKRIVEQKYESDKVLAQLSAIRQSLILHGLSAQQVAEIEKTRQVLQTVTVEAPRFASIDENIEVTHRYHVQSIDVNRGQSVLAGQLLGILADHSLLYVEGQAFEDDAAKLLDVIASAATIPVVPSLGKRQAGEVLHLRVQSVADQIDRQSRALKFYLLLPNSSADSDPDSNFVAWKFRPGQRMEARIPTGIRLTNKIVVPSEGVVVEGPNAFVFEQNGNNFDRVDVQFLYRDRDNVVLENDGRLIGSTIAVSGAYEMHLALKNQSGGAIDPHAGHSH